MSSPNPSDLYEIVTAYRCKTCDRIRSDIKYIEEHVKQHIIVNNFKDKYPIEDGPIYRDKEWMDELLELGGYGYDGPLSELLDKLRHYCPYCHTEFPNLFQFTQHNCNERKVNHEME